MKTSHLLIVLNTLMGTLLAVQGQTNLFRGYTKQRDGLIDDVPTVTLSNDREMPLIGLGVGNLQANRVENMIYEGLKAENKMRLIDTAHASFNEKEVAKGITTGVKRFKNSEKLDGRVQVHVVTKIWYTYLGYERTKLSVRESLEALGEAIKDPDVDLKVHFLIHWPRCYEGIEWMNCEQEEIDLPAVVKKAGPSPLYDKHAWKESWKALEDMYISSDYPVIASIGVSNFDSEELDGLVQSARVPPHMIQMNVWSLLNNPHLVEVCNRSNIHIQVFNVMNGILRNALATPHANHHLLEVANELGKESESSIDVKVPQVVLKWLVQYGISIIPRTSNLDRLTENSAVSLSKIQKISDNRVDDVGRMIKAMLNRNDVEDDSYVKVTFHAKNQDMFLYFVPENDENGIQISYISKGDKHEERTHPRHKFRIYNAYDPDVYHEHTVQGSYGDHHHVHVEL